MKKYILVGLIGFISGNAFWYLASPLWIDREVSETFEVTSSSKVLKRGKFHGADAAHQGAGRVEVIKTTEKTIIRFTDFKVTNGPDLYVWLVKAKGLKNSSDVKNSSTLELKALKGNIGDQNYKLPADMNIDDYGSVVVWCKQFGVLFASADID